MELVDFSKVSIHSGYLFQKQELNRKKTIYAVYDRFKETGRIGAFKFGYPKSDAIRPHYFWDSDVAKWIEGASYIIRKYPSPDLEEKIDSIVADIAANQCEDGYFNIYFTVVEPENRWKNRDWHELYCAGHLMEASIAYAQATGKTTFLHCMEKYARYIYRVFVEEKSAEFATPGHEEIELALVKMYRYTKKKIYLDLAEYFINTRGTDADTKRTDYNQSHIPVREQDSALGHSVRAMYLYTGMAALASEKKDKTLVDALKKLWHDTVDTKMYITGGLGSTHIGEAFTTPYDLPNDQAYTETCAGIGLCFFGNTMLSLENDASYADVVERVLYNGILSGLSLDGESFFYENPLEVNLSERFSNAWGARRFPPNRRVACFDCSCCPPNINRVLPVIGGYIYGLDKNTVYINQFIDSDMTYNGISCNISTEYPNEGRVIVTAKGVKRIAVRIPSYCDSVIFHCPHSMEKGYAIFENVGTPIVVDFDVKPRLVWAHARVLRDAGQAAIMRGPIVYCAEGIDNDEGMLHSYILPENISFKENNDDNYGLPTLDITCQKRLDDNGPVYRNSRPKTEQAILHLIPYNSFANRAQTNMRVWFVAR